MTPAIPRAQLLRRLGRSDLHVPTIIFGAWAIGGWFWGGTDDVLAIQAIQAGIDAGITAIDTAPMYGCGHSERIVGLAVAGRRERVQLLTKVGLRWTDERGAFFFETQGADRRPLRVYRNSRPDSVKWEVEQSLLRLGTDHLDLVQVHWPDPTTPVEETMGALAELVQAGKVRAIGVSNFGPQALEQARAALAPLPLASTQPRYSVLHRAIEADVLPWCRRHEVGAIVYSPLERGLLTGKVPADRHFPSTDGRSTDPLYAEANRRAVNAALERLLPLAEDHHCTLAQLMVAWTLHQPGVTAAIVGARRPAQIEENAGAARVRLKAEELASVEAAFAGLPLKG